MSEIERGTRDLPFSTLHALVHDGLERHLEIGFGARPTVTPARSTLPRAVERFARELAELPAEERAVVLAIARGAVKLATR